LAVNHVIEPTTVLRIIHNDPDDDHILAATLAANVDLIVSSDDDRINLENY
jgi:predicted nucleic acid-binding protein